MKLRLTPKVQKAYQKLPSHIQSKTDKALHLLLNSPSHPGLNVKKMSGLPHAYEARIDYQYRFAFTKTTDELIIIHLGPHDTGLGKK